MDFEVFRTSDSLYEPRRTQRFDSLKSLIDFMDLCGNPIVIYRDYPNEDTILIEVYDDYRE